MNALESYERSQALVATIQDFLDEYDIVVGKENVTLAARKKRKPGEDLCSPVSIVQPEVRRVLAEALNRTAASLADMMRKVAWETRTTFARAARAEAEKTLRDIPLEKLHA